MERETFGAIDYRRRQVLKAKSGHPSSELSTQGSGRGSRASLVLLRREGEREEW
jgi:hypothetical protein